MAGVRESLQRPPIGRSCFRSDCFFFFFTGCSVYSQPPLELRPRFLATAYLDYRCGFCCCWSVVDVVVVGGGGVGFVVFVVSGGVGVGVCFSINSIVFSCGLFFVFPSSRFYTLLVFFASFFSF